MISLVLYLKGITSSLGAEFVELVPKKTPNSNVDRHVYLALDPNYKDCFAVTRLKLLVDN